MPTDVCYPKISLETSTGRISRWLIDDGAVVCQGAILFEVDSDKAAVEVEAPAAGTVRRLVDQDVEVAVGVQVARIYCDGERYEASHTGAQDNDRRPLTDSKPAPTRPPNPTPLARRLARDHGIALDQVVGTGPRGRITRNDVIPMLNRESQPNLGAAEHPEIQRSGSVAAGADLLNAIWMRRGEGMPIVMLHGFAADSNNWRAMLASGRIPVPVLALDLPAHGGSPRSVPSDLNEAAAAVEKTIAGLKLGPIVLCGHSFGGALAARVARRAQIDTRAVCMFSPAGLGPEINKDFVEGVLRARAAESLRPWLECLYHDPSRVSDALLGTVVQQRRDRDLTDAMEKFAKVFFTDGTQTFSIRSDLNGIRHPVRIVFGVQDRILPVTATRGIPENVGLHFVDSCGHMPHLERSVFADNILQEVYRSA